MEADVHIFFLLGYMLLYLFSVQTIALGSTYLIVRSRHLAASLTGAIFACMSLAGGYLVHTDDVGIWASWLRYASPQVYISLLYIVNISSRIFVARDHFVVFYDTFLF